MGNRATVIFTDGKESFSPAVYLHWNGSPESVYGFLEELNRRGVRADQEYECARFIQLVGEFFDQDTQGGYSLGIANGPKSDSLADLKLVGTDKGDNGIYLVNRINGLSVRRFTEDYRNETIEEMSKENVDRERFTAYSHKYGLLRDNFTEIARGRKVAAY